MSSARLDLRRWHSGDGALLYGIVGDPVTMHAWPKPLERAEAEAWIAAGEARFAQNRTARFALVRREDGVVIGDAGLVPAFAAGRDILDLGYIVHHPFWRQGYGYEAASALVRYAFDDLDRPAVHAHMAEDNVPSWSLAEKLGMRRIADFPHERDRGKMHRLYELSR